jgi:hypothetical protein
VSAASQNHADRAHARFAPSAAERWINCPDSIRAQEGMADVSGDAAEEGTRMHEAASAILEGMDRERATRELTPEQTALVEEYTDAVEGKFAALRRQDPGARLIVERRMHAPGVHPDFFGTGDTLMVARRVLHVDDLKSGWKPVAVRYPDGRLNAQLASYVVLALAELGAPVSPFLFDPGALGIERVVLTVHQPRVYDRPEQTRVTIAELREFLTVLVDAIERVERGDPTRKADPSWCRYCLARGRCPTLRAEANKRAAADFDPTVENLPLNVAAELLAEADWLEAQAKGARESVYRALFVGKSVAGSKLVEKKGRREWLDFERAAELAISHGVPESSLYRRQPISPAQMETLLKLHKVGDAFPWQKWRECAEKKSSGFTVVGEDDPRTAIVRRPGDDFPDLVP